jgi:hypothetical protein
VKSKAVRTAARHQTGKIVMKKIAIALVLTFATTGAYADSCKATSTDKNLHGAAQTSFMKKCETDAKTACDAQAAEKKLNGAAKTSFTKKCVTDAVGT